MRFLLCIVGVLLALSASTAGAEPICYDSSRRPVALSEGQLERNYILANEWDSPIIYAGQAYARRRNRTELVKVLSTLGLAGPLLENTYGSLPCDSSYQAEILTRRVRELGPKHPYIERLAANQVRALRNCYAKAGETDLPVRNWDDISSAYSDIKVMAEQDFAYLTGVANFHAHRFVEALEGFSKVGANANSPHRMAARLMEVRTLRELERPTDAYELARRYRTEAAPGAEKEALDEQEDIIAQYAGTSDYAAAHLEKIYKRAAHLPIKNEPIGFREEQAATDLELYFITETARLANPRYRSLPHDWWLRDEPMDRNLRAFIAVRDLAKRIDGIDWIEAYHASDAYSRANSWFSGPDFDVDDPAYARVTEHAYRKWKGGSGKWGLIVAKRMAANSRYVPEVEKYVGELRDKAAACALNPSEFQVYVRMTQHLARALAVAGEYEEAFATITALKQNRFYPTDAGAEEAFLAFTNLLLAKGRRDLIKKFNDARLTQYDEIYSVDWGAGSARPIVMWDEDSVEVLAMRQPGLAFSMINMMTVEELEMLVMARNGNGVFAPPYQKRALAVLWMRAFVFGDEERMQRIGPKFFGLYPGLKRYYRQAQAAQTSEARDFAYAVMVLRNPGLTPYADKLAQRTNGDVSQYDNGNPVEGNWWCAADDRSKNPSNEKRLRTAFFDPAFSTTRYSRLQYRLSQRDLPALDSAWAEFRRDYPPFARLSKKEEEKLASLPRAADWLAARVRAYIESPAGVDDRSAPRDERIPESLHRIVDVTRYACHKSERGNAKTSRWAYETLHRYYGDTTWAAETPYWYDKLVH